MKKYLLFIILCSSFIVSLAQKNAPDSTLKGIQKIPAFKIFIAPDSTAFSSEALQKNKSFILMFFNPDCEHCQKETKELVAYKEELKDIQIVMISALPYKMIKDFYAEYNIASMPNIKMGQDLNYTLGILYRPTRYPAIYVYDAAGNLAKAFAGNAGVPAILAATK